MVTIKRYIKPQITIIAISDSKILCSSNSMDYICSEYCKLWHICQDRLKGQYCPDIEYKWR